MNNDDICIHCELTKEEHEQNTPWCHDFKSISQHYAEQRGPENLKVMKDIVSWIEAAYYDDQHEMPHAMRSIYNTLNQAIEASKPHKE